MRTTGEERSRVASWIRVGVELELEPWLKMEANLRLDGEDAASGSVGFPLLGPDLTRMLL